MYYKYLQCNQDEMREICWSARHKFSKIFLMVFDSVTIM